MIFKPWTVALVGVVLLGAPACTPVGVVMGAGAATGLAAYQERGVDGVARDLAISGRVLDMYARFDHTLVGAVGVEVYESRVLLTGQLESEDRRADAVRLAWRADGVKDVINEIVVTGGGNLLDTAEDSWISAQLEYKLTFDKKVFAINYAIETVGGTVYLMGIAQNEEELRRVKDHARAVPYVQRIVSHVRVKEPAPMVTAAPGGS
ncbi:MAG: BON domain-containing protein [Alphaproteobacteria bacterium]|nr:BON domain-containing protein [Alphaproteobacteria bacterium]